MNPSDPSILPSSVVSAPETTPPLARRYYLVRSCRNIPLESGVVGVGWDDFRFCDYSDPEKLISDMHEDGWELNRQGNQIRRYLSIRKGDVVVFPYWGTIVIGEALGQMLHDPMFDGQNGANQHRVRFPLDAEGHPKQVPRSALSEAFQRRLKIRMTVTDLWEFADEINKFLNALDGKRDYSRTGTFDQFQGERAKALRDQLLENIQSGRTGLQSGGLGLEDLVRELLTIDGFEATALGKRHFEGSGADADIFASKTDALRTDEFLVQVKHHAGHTGEWGIEQLKAIPEKHHKYADCQLVLVTSGQLMPEVSEAAAKHDIIVKDGPALVDWIIESLPRLSRDTQIALGIVQVPQLLP